MGILPMIWTRDRIKPYSIIFPNTHGSTEIIAVKWMLKSVNSAGSKPELVYPVVSLSFFSLDPEQDLKEREIYEHMQQALNYVSELQNFILFDLCIHIKN